MNIQNVYTLRDGVYCPEGSGKIITDYLNGVFSRLSSEIKKVSSPIDWLAVDSIDLAEVCFTSQNFFEKRFEEILKEEIKPRNVSFYRFDAKCCLCPNSKSAIESWIAEKLKTDFKINYLKDLDLSNNFVGYHLNMRD